MNLESLEQIARGATRETWINRDHMVDSISGFICECFEDEDPQQSRNDCKYIATFHPALILKMIKELKAGRELRDRIIIRFVQEAELADLYDSARKETDGL